MPEPTAGSWEFGAIREGEWVRIEVTATTTSGEPVTILFHVSPDEALAIAQVTADAGGGAIDPQAAAPREARPSAAPSTAPTRASARAQGFTGDACTVCGSFTLVRTGTCVTCQSCGNNAGCG
ncbi:hypothetical protein [Salinarimonas soli]|uniref:Uncharacterized protein n=1 Tax=Salinarimonas soli TaxID=1638099 RepID=A0A5B2VF95_9HYPH|nr:hypothetical protein [Salinarimonas soli]KAA2237791.1 hypothetical protein F0L46_08960 [Salinarimonas soli]